MSEASIRKSKGRVNDFDRGCRPGLAPGAYTTGRSVLAEGARPLVMNLETAVSVPKNMTVMAASSGAQISSTYREKGHGLFTYFMLKGIKNEGVLGPDGSMMIEDLFGYVKPQVERIARRQYNNEQTPQLINHKVP